MSIKSIQSLIQHYDKVAQAKNKRVQNLCDYFETTSKVELKQCNTDRWVCLSVDRDGEILAQSYDAAGIDLVEKFNTTEKAVTKFVKAGYTRLDQGAMDKLCTTSTWVENTHKRNQLAKLNKGEISLTQYLFNTKSTYSHQMA